MAEVGRNDETDMDLERGRQWRTGDCAVYIRRCSLEISESFDSKSNWKGGELRDRSVRRHTDPFIENLELLVHC